MGSRSWCLAVALVCLGCGAPPIISGNKTPDGGVADSGADGRFFVGWDTSALPAGDAVVATYDGGDNCRRSVNLTAVSIGRPVPFDVVIVADNSDSLSWSRDSLSAGLKNLLSRVHGHQARFFVLTTTQYGASSKTAVSPFTGKDLVTWRDSVTGAAYAHPVTDYVQSCFDDKGAAVSCSITATSNSSFTLRGAWQFQMPAPIAAITPDMTDAQVAAQQKSLADAILALGGGGAQQEQPLCTLSRYLTQSPQALPKHVVFVVLTDEDDSSPPAACLASYEAKREPATAEHYDFCNTNCTKYMYQAVKTAFDEGIKFRCIPVDDTGKAHPERAFEKSTLVNLSGACTAPAGAACTPAQITTATTTCGAGHTVDSCQTTCVVSPGTMLACNLDRPDTSVDVCHQGFDEQGKHYANLLDYCRQLYNSEGWRDCTVYGLKLNPIMYQGQKETVTPLVPGNDTSALIASFKTTADRLIGRGGYSVETIVLDPSFSCPLHPGQSYASNLRQLATSADDVFALCQDYGPALRRVESFAEYLIQTEFPLDLSAYEDVDSVLATNRTGMQRVVPKTAYRYDRSAKILRLNAGSLTAADATLAVSVARYCEPVVK